MAPSAPKEVITALGALSLHYWRPDFTQEQARMLYGDYISDLSDYPIDLILDGIKAYRKKPEAKWFPKVGELIALVEPHYRKRLAIAAEIRSRLNVPKKELGLDQETRTAGAEMARKFARSLGQ